MMALAGCTVTSNRFWTVRLVIFPYSTTWATTFLSVSEMLRTWYVTAGPRAARAGPDRLYAGPAPPRAGRVRSIIAGGSTASLPRDRRRLGLRPLEERRDRQRRDHAGRAQAVQDQQGVGVVALDRWQRRHVPRDVHVRRAPDHADRDLPRIALDDRQAAPGPDQRDVDPVDATAELLGESGLRGGIREGAVPGLGRMGEDVLGRHARHKRPG